MQQNISHRHGKFSYEKLTHITSILHGAYGLSFVVAEPPKRLGPTTPVIVLRTSDGDAGDPSTLEVR